jgi:uncharacterized protein YraI
MTAKYFAPRAALAGAILLLSQVALAQQVTISRDSTLHATPSTDAAAVAQLKQGATAEVVGRQGTWVNVKTPAGTGWMFSFNVTYPSGGGPAAASAPAPKRVTATAGIRGLEKEELKNAQFDGKQLDALDSFAGGDSGEKPPPRK